MIAVEKNEVDPTPVILGKHTPLSAGGWALASYIISYAVGGLIFIPLARFLTPTDFGLYTEATVFYGFITVMIQLPLIRALVRATGDRYRAAQAILSLSLVAGLTGAVVCALLGFPLSVIYRTNPTISLATNVIFKQFGYKLEPISTGSELIPIMFIMAVGVLASALGAVPVALLSRELNFRRKLLPDTLSLAIGAAVAVVAALLGLGVYTLILYALTRAVSNAVIAWLVVSWRPQMRWAGWREIRPFLPFVVPTGGGELALQARFNMDFAIGGAQIGSSALGIYTLAWDSADKPAKIVNSFFDQVGFASFARIQKNLPRVRQLYFSATRLLASVTIPIFIGVLFLRQDIVTALLGAKWQATVEPMLPLFILQALWIIFHPAGELVLALGHSRVYALVNGISLAGTIVAVVIGAGYGVNGLAWSMLFASGLTSIAWGILVMFYLRPSRAEVWQAAIMPLAFTITVLPTIALMDWLTNLAHLPAIVRLGTAILLAAVIFLIVGWRSLPSLKQDLARLHEKLPVD